MDTNRNNGQNYQINAFNKGMNTDTALDAVGEGQYIFGLNIRIANNTLLVGNIDPNSKEGLVTPVEEGKIISGIDFEQITSILATASIGDVGVVIVKYPYTEENSDPEQRWKVYRVDKSGDTLSANLLYESKSATDKDKFSVVINKEQEDVIKLYIADGEHGIMLLFVKNGEDPTKPVEIDGETVNVVDLTLLNNATSEDYLVSGKYFPSDKATIVGTTSGRLKTQQVQYTYRFYKRFGISSKLAPLTNKIQIINSNRNVEEGNAENTRTNLGMKLRIALTDDVKKLFDHLQLIRVSYVVAGQVPEIEVVKDLILPDDSQLDTLDIVDAGEDPLEELSLDEFHALNAQSIIPQVIELNQGFMFAANIKDETVIQIDDLTKSAYLLYNNNQVAKKISYELVNLEISVCDNDLNLLPINSQTYFYSYRSHSYGLTLSNYLEWQKVEEPAGTNGDFNNGYENIIISSLLRSLARGETYTYGIVFYNKYGQRSDVICIDDITVPEESEAPSWKYENNVLKIYPIGVSFSVEKPSWAVGYEIVQKQKTTFEFKYLLLCALSRPVLQSYGSGKEEADKHMSPYYPLPFITSNFCSVSHMEWSNDGDNLKLIGYFCRNTRNRNLFLIFAPEILYRRTDTLTKLQYSNTQLSCLYYTYDAAGVLENIKKSSPYCTNQEEIQIRVGDLTTNIDPTEHPEYWPVYMIRYNSETSPNRGYFGFSEGMFVIRPHLSGFKKETKSSETHNVKLWNRSNFVESDLSKKLTYYKNITSGTIPYQSDAPFAIQKKDLFDTSTPLNLTDIAISDILITRIKDVKNPQWNSGFSDIQTTGGDSEMTSAVKAYKSYTTPMAVEYLNWVCNGMYDLPVTMNEAENYFFANTEYSTEKKQYRALTDTKLDYYAWRSGANTPVEKNDTVRGWIGPGPVCLLANIEDTSDTHVLNLSIISPASTKTPGTIIANIKNTQLQIDSDREYYTYFGCGNYYKSSDAIVFDGDRYILPCEFVSMFKAYDFKSIDDTIDSSQVVYYIPLESKINPFFDYGMNYRNTKSKNLLLEPGSIIGIATQDRPLHQYNSIYSDNNTSVSTYIAQPKELHTNTFPLRICYSQHKDNGELIESWNTFKPVDYIDADTRYGEITNLLSANDTIFFWLNRAFGKLSVNERSLVTDNNNNTIQLGQGGVLQRTDYLSTKYGMRPEDYSAINTENGLFWIDILNKAVVANTKEGVINYGEQLNVLNLINNRMSDNKPEIDYDLLNSELLCKCFDDGDQLVFNIKYNIATSVYTRNYDKMLYFNNIMYALKGYNRAKQLNYLSAPKLNEEQNYNLLSPTILLFVVNSNPSLAKVFDNQKIVVAAKDWKTSYTQQLEFKTDTNAGASSVSLGLLVNDPLPFGRVTDREANICYAVPRETTTDSHPQLRMRGKWMTVKITDNNPKLDFAISHIITKFRQSYS